MRDFSPVSSGESPVTVNTRRFGFIMGSMTVTTPFMSFIEEIISDQNKVKLSNGKVLNYDYLIIATGTHPRPDETPGMGTAAWPAR